MQKVLSTNAGREFGGQRKGYYQSHSLSNYIQPTHLIYC